LNYSHHVVFFPRDGSFLLREIEEGGLIKLPINFEVRNEKFLPIPTPILAGLKFLSSLLNYCLASAHLSPLFSAK
jgi:hypothetical protein